MELKNGISLIERYEELKNLVQQKQLFEKNSQENSPEYRDLHGKIQTLLQPMSEKEFNHITRICSQENDQIRNFLGSDIEQGVVAHLNEKLNLNETCYNYIQNAAEQNSGKGMGR